MIKGKRKEGEKREIRGGKGDKKRENNQKGEETIYDT